MIQPIVRRLPLEGLLLIEPRRFVDARGAFMETWSEASFSSLGLSVAFVQDNCSFSRNAGTVRGLHGQSPPNAQDKLVWVAQGEILDVAVDIRVGSPTYGQHSAVALSSETGAQLLVPKGFLHGFVTRAPNTVVIYKCSGHYAPESEIAVRFDDPALQISWELESEPILSNKDAAAPSFADLRSPFFYTGASQ